MNKKIIIPLALAPLAAPALQAQHQQPNGRTDTRPNIILFMVDDMGWQDTSLPFWTCLLYTSPSPRDGLLSRMPSSA